MKIITHEVKLSIKNVINIYWSFYTLFILLGISTTTWHSYLILTSFTILANIISAIYHAVHAQLLIEQEKRNEENK